LTAIVDTTENRSKKIRKKEKPHMRQYTPTYQRGKDRRNEEKKKNRRIKRDNINIGEQFFAMANMLATSGSWIYGQEEEKKKLDIFFSPFLLLFFLSFSLVILCRYATTFVINYTYK
jgi:hypothetical protein